mgnify:CR=1 FL=1
MVVFYGAIEAWFSEYGEDGEFVHADRAAPYSVIGPLDSTRWLVFTSKPKIVSEAIENCWAPAQLGMVGRYGLPDETDLNWLRGLIGSCELLFLGDMDPVDLMVYLWLRESLKESISHLGVNDAFLDSLELASTESLCMPCALPEQKALIVLEQIFPDLRETIGTEYTQLLKRGYKIEVEGIVSAKQGTASILRSAMLSHP